MPLAEREIAILARRAVILSCGGYEYDHSIHLHYWARNTLVGNPRTRPTAFASHGSSGDSAHDA